VTKNPLTMIGLTPAILGLGLTQDELYEYCTRIARALFACVHPDRHNGTQRPEALHFSEAFDLLKDRKVFHAAIKEFQGQRRQGSAPPTPRSTEEDTLRLRFQELQRRNVLLMREEKKLRARVQQLEKVNAILRQSVHQWEESHNTQSVTHRATQRGGRLPRARAHDRRGGAGAP
jgi:hypothetical protein